MIQGSGGQGVPVGPQWDPLVAGATAAGRRVVRIGGAAGQAWEAGAGSIALASCRIAELVAWARATYHVSPGPYCGLGSSGGASALVYVEALHDGAGLDGVVLANGAPLSRLDCGCGTACGATVPNACVGAPHSLAYPATMAAGIDSWGGTSSCGAAAPIASDIDHWQGDDAAKMGTTDWGPHAVAVTCAGAAVSHGHLELLRQQVPGIARTCVPGCTNEAVLTTPAGRAAVLSAVLSCGSGG